MLKFAKILIIALLLAGCSEPITPDPDPKPEPNKDELFKEPQGNIVTSPVSIPFVYGNPIEIISTNDPRSFNIEVRGLKNKVIENKINDEITKKMDTLFSYASAANLPPYRGIYAKIPSNSTAVDYFVNSYVSYNYNNVLSISFNGWYNFYVDGKAEYVTVSDALNFDLITGNHLTVNDLLTNDVNSQNVINNPLSVAILKSADLPDDQYWGYTPLNLVAPFKGIKGNQIFYITNNGIMFIFDYRNPEFINGFHSIQLMLGFYELMPFLAIADRFKSDINIYEDPIRHAEFLYLSKNALRDEQGNVRYKDVDIYTYRSVGDDVPAFYTEKLPEVLPIVQSMIDEYSGEKKIEYAYATQYAEMVGEYVNLSWYASIYADKIIYEEWRATYDKNGEIMTIKDLFVDGYMYRDFLWSEFVKVANDLPWQNYDKETILDSLQFTVGHSGIYFSTYQKATETTEEFTMSIYVSYNDINMDYLTLFDNE